MKTAILSTVTTICLMGCNAQPSPDKPLITQTRPAPKPSRQIYTIPESKAGHTTVEGLKITYAHLNTVIFSHGGEAHSGLNTMRLRLDNPTDNDISIEAHNLWLSTQRCQDTDWEQATPLKPTRWASQPNGHIKNNRITVNAGSTLHIAWHHDTHKPRGGCGYGFVFSGVSGQRYKVIVPVRFEREADER